MKQRSKLVMMASVAMMVSSTAYAAPLPPCSYNPSGHSPNTILNAADDMARLFASQNHTDAAQRWQNGWIPGVRSGRDAKIVETFRCSIDGGITTSIRSAIITFNGWKIDNFWNNSAGKPNDVNGALNLFADAMQAKSSVAAPPKAAAAASNSQTNTTVAATNAASNLLSGSYYITPGSSMENVAKSILISFDKNYSTCRQNVEKFRNEFSRNLSSAQRERTSDNKWKLPVQISGGQIILYGYTGEYDPINAAESFLRSLSSQSNNFCKAPAQQRGGNSSPCGGFQVEANRIAQIQIGRNNWLCSKTSNPSACVETARLNTQRFVHTHIANQNACESADQRTKNIYLAILESLKKQK